MKSEKISAKPWKTCFSYIKIPTSFHERVKKEVIISNFDFIKEKITDEKVVMIPNVEASQNKKWVIRIPLNYFGRSHFNPAPQLKKIGFFSAQDMIYRIIQNFNFKGTLHFSINLGSRVSHDPP